MSSTTALHKGLQVLKALKGHTLAGLSNQQLVQATDLNASAITRIMAALIDEGLAEKREDGRFALSVGMLQIAQRHALEMQRAQEKIDEINRRVLAGAQR
ncbi:helix-turn-helix domain-containing protein [Microbulbifer sp. OS29]|uniref:Helix-turn-helix domain-containing protein n=1 Tax=Microbulbifer okhotskensis TaxID=2926617 RepID=A0A9X2EQT9_9GAMM|nr:helix-turn-helix domain-containing protein [Microbulbifer okhotskensis]MCO1336769.1 helix-turn-helix domain-containing protein [Microbulbifer okhotskensis]